MKIQIKNFTHYLGFISSLLLAIVFLNAGCATSHPDSLAGWKPLFGRDYEKVDAGIKSDYQNYVQNLSPEEKNSVGPIFLFENEAGQHAAKITIGVNGVVWRNIIIYDQENRRIKTIKYASGNYGS